MSHFTSCIYSGFVTHERFKPKKHFFSYKTFSLLIDLNEIEDIEKKIKFFSYNKFNILSFYNLDHGNRDGSSLIKWVKNTLKKSKLNFKIGKIKLLCYPRFFGYVFNPLSIFYCYDENLQLKAVLYEVKNTFNEQHTYIFKIKDNQDIAQRCKIKFYVSPFMDMETYYNFRLLNPDEKLTVFIKQTDANGTILTATQTGVKKELNFKQLVINFFRYPLMTVKIISSIHFEALLLWRKGAIYRKRSSKIKNNLSFEEY